MYLLYVSSCEEVGGNKSGVINGSHFVETVRSAGFLQGYVGLDAWIRVFSPLGFAGMTF
jgi:hypothetical protein